MGRSSSSTSKWPPIATRSYQQRRSEKKSPITHSIHLMWSTGPGQCFGGSYEDSVQVERKRSIGEFRTGWGETSGPQYRCVRRERDKGKKFNKLNRLSLNMLWSSSTLALSHVRSSGSLIQVTWLSVCGKRSRLMLQGRAGKWPHWWKDYTVQQDFDLKTK